MYRVPEDSAPTAPSAATSGNMPTRKKPSLKRARSSTQLAPETVSSHGRALGGSDGSALVSEISAEYGSRGVLSYTGKDAVLIHDFFIISL